MAEGKCNKKRRNKTTSSGIPTARRLIRHLTKHRFDAAAIDAYVKTGAAARKATGLALPELPTAKELAASRASTMAHRAKWADRANQMRQKELQQ